MAKLYDFSKFAKDALGTEILNVKIEGKPEQLVKIAAFLKAVAILGSYGASRSLQIWVDGDGAARLKVDFGTVEVLNPLTDEMLDHDVIKLPGID